MNRFFILVLAILTTFAGVAVAQTTSALLPPVGEGYWHTAGTEILDSHGQEVRIAAVSWYGMETAFWVPAGLDYQPYQAIMARVKALGYNAIRLPLSNEVVETNPIVTQHINANPELAGKHALAVLDLLVAEAATLHLKLILDNHLGRASRPKNVNYLLEPLWYTPQYPQSVWQRDWESLARRYLGQDAVIGFDLRNEPHTAGPGAWDLAGYLTRGATWGPYGGVDNPATDWRLAAERAGNAVLAINPHLLVFVEGVQLYPNPTVLGGASSYWWGSELQAVRRYPVVLSIPHQLVYSVHDWGPWKWNMPWFRQMTYQSLSQVWRQHWAFLLDDPNASYAAPVWIGEFGTCTSNPGCIDQQAPGNAATWFHLLLRFLRDHPEVGWGLWALNGTNANRNPANNGLLNRTWDGLASPLLQADLASVQSTN